MFTFLTMSIKRAQGTEWTVHKSVNWEIQLSHSLPIPRIIPTLWPPVVMLQVYLYLLTYTYRTKQQIDDFTVWDQGHFLFNVLTMTRQKGVLNRAWDLTLKYANKIQNGAYNLLFKYPEHYFVKKKNH